ncbi:hypothetical protein Y032_0816g2507, partial [Ancylostoma ceylanicum]
QGGETDERIEVLNLNAASTTLPQEKKKMCLSRYLFHEVITE